MKKIYIRIVLFLVSLIGLTSCDSQLSDINANPNATEHPQPAYLLSAAQYHAADWFWGSSLNYNATLLWVQHWAKIQYTEPDCYNVTNSDFTSVWDEAYATIIADLNAVVSSEQSNENFKAVARIWRSWTYLQLTNLYGDIPYTQYGRSVTPTYDTQETVLRSLLTELESADAAIDTASGAISGDLIYDNDLSKWKKLAKSLRLRIALELADRDATTARTILASLYSERAQLIASVDDNARFVYTSSPQWNPWASAFSTRDDQRMSKTLIDELQSLNDPRLPIYAQLPQDETVGTYQGARNGLSADAANSQGFYKLSKPGTSFLADAAPAVFFTYAEVNFIFAEAAARGFIQADAASLYVAGIKASLAQYGVDNAAADAYVAQSQVAYQAGKWAELIGWQKWIALFGQAPDAFTEWRRLGYPALTAGPASVLERGQLPRRLYYPDTEQSLNGESYRTAVAHQGADELTTRLWFDVENKNR